MKFKSSFQKTMWLGSFISLICVILFFGGNALWKNGLLFSLGVTALTIFLSFGNPLVRWGNCCSKAECKQGRLSEEMVSTDRMGKETV